MRELGVTSHLIYPGALAKFPSTLLYMTRTAPLPARLDFGPPLVCCQGNRKCHVEKILVISEACLQFKLSQGLHCCDHPIKVRGRLRKWSTQCIQNFNATRNEMQHLLSVSRRFRRGVDYPSQKFGGMCKGRREICRYVVDNLFGLHNFRWWSSGCGEGFDCSRN